MTLGLVCGAGCRYLIGAAGVTVAANVPLNDQLAAAAAGSLTDDAWHRWASAWTARNHVRTTAALLAAAGYTAAILRRAG